jgi:hypothetical protein
MSDILSKERICNILYIALLILVIEGCGGGVSQTTSSSSVTTGTALLSWSQVTTYTDNSPLTPAGYKVYYGTAHNTYTAVVNIPVSSLVTKSTPTCVIKNLSRNTYYFAVSVYDASTPPAESALSTEASKVIL